MYRIIGADGREYGPISADQLRQWTAENRANAATRVRVEDSTEWKTLGSLPEFSQLFPGQAPQSGSAPAVLPSSGVPIPKNNGFAVAGMVLGIFSLTFGLCCCYGLPFNVLGLIFSAVGLTQISNDPQRYRGKGMAIAGLVLCIVSLFIAVLFLVVIGANAGWDQITHHAYRL